MQNLFHLSIMTPDDAIYDGNISSLVAPGRVGYLGVLANHAPLITALVPGKITIKGPSQNLITFNSAGNGFLEVSKNKAVILADSISPA